MSEKFRKNNIAQSVFEKNYQQLPELKKEILDQKYNCSICLELIKYENPFLCYECQKIFHHSCLKGWDTKQKQLNKKLSYPNRRNELAFENWKVLRNYDYASITLFSSAPDGNIPLATKWLTKNYGTPISEFDGMNSLVCKLSGSKMYKLNSYKFIIEIDYIKCKVILKIYNAKNVLINNDIYWDFDTLESKLKSKLSYLAIVNSKKKILNSLVYYAYTDLKCYKLKSFSTFLKLLETGIITLNIKTGVYKSGPYKGKFHDHGVSFCINKNNILKLFDKIDI